MLLQFQVAFRTSLETSDNEAFLAFRTVVLSQLLYDDTTGKKVDAAGFHTKLRTLAQTDPEELPRQMVRNTIKGFRVLGFRV